MNKKIIFVGMGSANMFAVLRLLKYGIKGSDIIMIDRGKSPHERTREGKDVVHGFAGAGLWSDGKMVFSKHQDSSIIKADMREEYFKDIIAVLDEFQIQCETITHPSSVNIDMGELDILQSTVYHLGTNGNVSFGKKIYSHFLKSGVGMLFNTLVTSIDIVEGFEKVGIVPADNSESMYDFIKRVERIEGNWVFWKSLSELLIRGRHIQVGLGKTGVDQFRKLVDKFNIKIDTGSANIGFRFEMDYNDKVKNIVQNMQYDFKFNLNHNTFINVGSNNYSCRMSIRTFCVNNASAYVIVEPFDIGDTSYVTYNGHGYGLNNHDKYNGKTNFGVMTRIKVDSPDFDANTMNENFIKLFGTDGIIIKMNGYHGGTMQDIIRTILCRAVESNMDELYMGVLMKWSDLMNRFMYQLSCILNYGESYLRFPEVKMAGGIVATNNHFVDIENRFPNVSWVGDCHTGVVGIVPSAVTGMMGADGICEKLYKG